MSFSRHRRRWIARDDEVGKTLKDLQVRSFVETSAEYPRGIRQMVMPIRAQTGPVLGALVLEYTPLYDQLMELADGTIREVSLAGMGMAILALVMALGAGRSIARPLEQLSRASAQFTERKQAIEALKHAEENLVENERRQRVILDNIPDHVWLKDREGRYLV